MTGMDLLSLAEDFGVENPVIEYSPIRGTILKGGGLHETTTRDFTVSMVGFLARRLDIAVGYTTYDGSVYCQQITLQE